MKPEELSTDQECDAITVGSVRSLACLEVGPGTYPARHLRQLQTLIAADLVDEHRLWVIPGGP